MSHTPGPWKLGDDEAFVYALNSAGTNRFFLQVQAGWITEGKRNSADDKRTEATELQANARLIAAAPDLAAALRKALAVLAGEEMSKSALIDALRAGGEALGKAGCVNR